MNHIVSAAETVGGDALMSQAEQDRRIDYVEFLTTNMNETKKFYSGVFGWKFTDYGPDYTSFNDWKTSKPRSENTEAGSFGRHSSSQAGGDFTS
jgi:predicted enzyme related to lactoylglutathione lyase